jgi:two-component system OmpR family sensor kinase
VRPARRDHGPHCVPPEGRRGFFLRWRLQRRIFAWFGLSILVTGLVVGGMVGFGGQAGWRRDYDAMLTFAGSRFARAWDDAEARRELGQSVAASFRVDLVVEDADRHVLERHGEPCPRPRVVVPVQRDGRLLGTVGVCSERRRRPGPWSLAAPLGVTLLVLWGASRLIARRLARPIVEIERVASEIGAGNLDSRVDLSRARGPDEALLGATLNTMAERIQRQIGDYRALLATVSHEVRTPLARMRLLAELARDQPGKLDDLDREIVELDALVGELLALSRVDFGALRKTRLAARDLALRALDASRTDPSILDADADARVEGDATLLVRAIVNLLENARKHGGGAVRLHVARSRGGVVFEVEDEGPGLGESEEERIFEPFYRGRGAGEKDGRSVGLGLALVRRIAEAHGGGAHAASREGKGARVGFTVPEA